MQSKTNSELWMHDKETDRRVNEREKNSKINVFKHSSSQLPDVNHGLLQWINANNYRFFFSNSVQLYWTGFVCNYNRGIWMNGKKNYIKIDIVRYQIENLFVMAFFSWFLPSHKIQINWSSNLLSLPLLFYIGICIKSGGGQPNNYKTEF